MFDKLLEARQMPHGNEVPGLLMSNGKTWSEQRRFTLRTLRDFGFGTGTDTRDVSQ